MQCRSTREREPLISARPKVLELRKVEELSAAVDAAFAPEGYEDREQQ